MASPVSGLSRHQVARGGRVERDVAVHLAVDLEPRRAARAAAPASRASSPPRAGCSMPKLLCDSSAAFGLRPKRIISSAAMTVISASCSARRVVVDVGVDQHHLAAGQDQAVHAGVGLGACAQADHLVDVVQVHRRSCPRCRRACRRPRPSCSSIAPISVRRRRISILASCAVTPLRAVMLVVGLPVVAEAVVVLGVDEVVVAPGLQAQAELLDALRDHLRAGRSASAARGPRRPRPAPRAARAPPRPRRRRRASSRARLGQR